MRSRSASVVSTRISRVTVVCLATWSLGCRSRANEALTLSQVRGRTFHLQIQPQQPLLLAFLQTIPDTANTPSRGQALVLQSMDHQYAYVERPTRSVEFYRRVFGFEPIDTDQNQGITDQTRLCAMRAGDRNRCLIQRNLYSASASVGVPAVARMVHENSQDDLRAEREEMHAAFAVDTSRSNQFEVSLIGQGGRLQGVRLTFPMYLSSEFLMQSLTIRRALLTQGGPSREVVWSSIPGKCDSSRTTKFVRRHSDHLFSRLSPILFVGLFPNRH